jgi:hypothetical protein
MVELPGRTGTRTAGVSFGLWIFLPFIKPKEKGLPANAFLINCLFGI